MRKLARLAAVGSAALAASAGCQTVDGIDPSTRPVVLRDAAPVGSPLARVSRGMTKLQVTDAIGEPSDSHGHLTQKNLNPFYFGSDRYRTVWYYVGQGRLTFDGDAKVMLVEYDPGEPGRPE